DGEGSEHTVIDGLGQPAVFGVDAPLGARHRRATERGTKRGRPKQLVVATLANLQIANGALAKGDGGAVVVEANASLLVSFVDFNGNSAPGGVGGAIAVHTGGELFLFGATFDRNTSAVQGGAVSSDGFLQAQFCRFTNNTSDEGGAVWVGDPGRTGNKNEIRQSEFYDNTARTQGGALYVDILTTVSVEAITAAFNDADIGGGLYNQGT